MSLSVRGSQKKTKKKRRSRCRKTVFRASWKLWSSNRMWHAGSCLEKGQKENFVFFGFRSRCGWLADCVTTVSLKRLTRSFSRASDGLSVSPS
mmetsp:Transcript_26966/g.70916  ORF Transcript_26966/g.70916 Transcript_26966/m.70916 type:complete len:93 (+) Transcript_26966:262-540(+)